MTLSRKFFSAPTLSRALLDAARHHSVEPDAIAYQVVEKKTGFVKAPRGVLMVGSTFIVSLTATWLP